MKKRHTLAYSSGNFANTLVQQVFTNRAQVFYVKTVGLSAGTVGAIWLVYGLWNVINDPIAGALSDRTRSRLGRRRPYLFWGSLPLGVAFFLIWTPPGGHGLAAAAWFALTVFVFDAIYSAVTVPYNAMFPALAATVRERARLSAVREALAVVALLLAFIAAPILSDEVGYLGMGVVVGAVTALTYWVSTFSGPLRGRDVDAVAVGAWASVRESLRSRSFRWYIGAHIATELVFVLLAAMLPFWAQDVLRLHDGPTLLGTLGEGDQEAVMLGVPFVLALPFLALWRAVMPRLGARVTWMVAFAALVPALLVMYAADGFSSALLGTTLIAPGLAGLQMLPICLISDVIDEDEAVTGVRREGMYFGMNGALTKVAFVFQGALFGAVLNLGGYDSHAAVQSGPARLAIRSLMTLAPVAACLAGAVFLYFCRPRVPASTMDAAAEAVAA
jgi:glycoside/pentoside/hexuronide:cation symporter, GPH family